MTKPIVQRVGDAITRRKIDCLPVVENGTLVGILTEGDFVRLVADAGRSG